MEIIVTALSFQLRFNMVCVENILFINTFYTGCWNVERVLFIFIYIPITTSEIFLVFLLFDLFITGSFPTMRLYRVELKLFSSMKPWKWTEKNTSGCNIVDIRAKFADKGDKYLIIYASDPYAASRGLTATFPRWPRFVPNGNECVPVRGVSVPLPIVSETAPVPLTNGGLGLVPQPPR